MLWFYVILKFLLNAFKNFAKVEKSYSGQTPTRFQAASHLTNSPLRQPPEKPEKNIFLTTTSQKPPTFPHWYMCELGENLLLDEKKDSRKKFKFFLLNRFIFPHLQLAPSDFNHTKRNSVSVSSFEAFTRILGLLFNVRNALEYTIPKQFL